MPAPKGESSSLKEPVVEVETVDMASTEVGRETANMVQIEREEMVQEREEEEDEEKLLSEYETDSDVGSDDWESRSLYEDALQFVRDEQLRDGGNSTFIHIPSSNLLTWSCLFLLNLVPNACTLDEALAYRNRLHEIGKADFVEETIARNTVSAKKLCTAFGILPPGFLDGAPDEAYHPLLAMGISREFSRRPKLPQYNTIEDAVRLLKESKNVIVLTGAGVSSTLFLAVPVCMDFCADIICPDLHKPWYP